MQRHIRERVEVALVCLIAEGGDHMFPECLTMWQEPSVLPSVSSRQPGEAARILLLFKKKKKFDKPQSPACAQGQRL